MHKTSRRTVFQAIFVMLGLAISAVANAQEAAKATVTAAAADGVVTLAARDATTHGKRLRYEPEPHKNTLGYWTDPADWCEWPFTARRGGRYELWVLQGCGKGQGGSEVEISVGDQKVDFTVEETGHFQNFKNRRVGHITLDKPGSYTLQIRSRNKAAAAVMDVRQVRLIPLNPEP